MARWVLRRSVRLGEVPTARSLRAVDGDEAGPVEGVGGGGVGQQGKLGLLEGSQDLTAASSTPAGGLSGT